MTKNTKCEPNTNELFIEDLNDVTGGIADGYNGINDADAFTHPPKSAPTYPPSSNRFHEGGGYPPVLPLPTAPLPPQKPHR